MIYQMEGSARYEVDGRRHTLEGGHVLVADGRLSGWGDSPFVEVQVPLSVFRRLLTSSDARDVRGNAVPLSS